MIFGLDQPQGGDGVYKDGIQYNQYNTHSLCFACIVVSWRVARVIMCMRLVNERRRYIVTKILLSHKERVI